ncbi:MAG: ATP-dependent Clp protease ATP-binding subunit, partial [Verrucomicrobia bacterium]|nr:ATP-dependent Clp protease ATP-binding subunit [Verrucomicrobiota bacterium]
KPKANLLLLGPPGVGKTEICNAFTEYLLASDKLVRFDMSEYQTLESIYRLLGHNGEEGLFGLNYDRVDGSGTLLFDEIEKAHERVLDLFLQLLSAARLTLGSGRVLNLEKFYVVATSNIGSPLLVGSKTNIRETLVRRVIQEARDQMRPEIFDRFDRVLVFNRLSYEVQIEVGRLHLQWEIEAQQRRGHKVTECDAEALRAIVRNGYSEKQGARRMRNAAREAVQEAVREALLSGRETSGRLEYNGHSKSFFINGKR